MTAKPRPWTLAFALSALVCGCSDDGEPRQEGDSASPSDDDDAGGTTGGEFPSSGITAESTSPTTGSSTTDDSGSSTGRPPDPTSDSTTTSSESGSSGSSESGETEGVSSSSSTGDDESSSSTSAQVVDTCFDIQLGIIPAKTAVSVPGLVVTGVAPSGNAFFAQHPEGGQNSGCYIFVGAVDISGLALGDEVTVEGVTEEFFDLTEINATEGMITETGSGVAVTVSGVDIGDFGSAATAEPWESVLVEVTEAQSLSVSNEPGGDEFVVLHTSDTVRVDNYLFSVYNAPGDFPGFGLGSSFTGITGVVNYNSSTFKLAPRSAADLAGYVQ